MRAMSPTHFSAMPRTCSRARSPNGWGITASGCPSQPRACNCLLPSSVNAVEHAVIAGTPRFTDSAVSWTLHDVQEPQSPEPVITRSQWAAMSA